MNVSHPPIGRPTSQAKSINIPLLFPELVDEVLKHLRSDRASLRACALVSQAWVHSARRYLFQSLWVAEARATLVRFVGSTPTVSCHIRELRLGHNATIIRSRHRLNPISVRQLLQYLPTLESLRIDAGFWEGGEVAIGDDPVLEGLPSTFPLLRTLVLTRVMIGGNVQAGTTDLRHNLRRLLVLFPSLKRIRLLHTWVGDDSRFTDLTSEDLPPLNLNLESLVIHTSQSTATLLNFFQTLQSTQSLLHLDIACPEPSLIQPLQKYIAEAGSCITHLRLDLTFMIAWVTDESE